MLTRGDDTLSLDSRPPSSFHAALESLALEGAQEFGETPVLPQDALEWVRVNCSNLRVMATASFSDLILVDHLAEHLPNAHVTFLDTGYHFPETIGLFDAALLEYPNLTFHSVAPKQSVAEQDREYGPGLWQRDPSKCCALRKVTPLREVLSSVDVWITGVRRDDHPSRAHTPLIAWNPQHRVIKVNPLAFLSGENAQSYSQSRGLLENPLTQIGYASIGCAPCTVPSEGREGRWAGSDKIECGLHV